jgi:hypothetical protein
MIRTYQSYRFSGIASKPIAPTFKVWSEYAVIKFYRRLASAR